MTVIPVSLGDRSYEVAIEPGGLGRAGERLAAYAPRGRFVVVTDSNVAAAHLNTLTVSLGTAGIRVEPIILPAGEATKSWSELAATVDWLRRSRR